MIGNIILDLLILAFIAFNVISGWKKGFIRVVLKHFSALFALVIAASFFSSLAPTIKENYIGPYFEEQIEEAIASGTQGSGITADSLTESVPEIWQKIAETVGIDLTGLAENAIRSGRNQIQEFVRSVSNSVAQLVSSAAAFALLFFGSYLALRLLALPLSKIVNSLPIVHGINQVLGLVFGLIVSLLITWIFVKVAAFASAALNWNVIAVEDTVLARLFYSFHPLRFLLGGK